MKLSLWRRRAVGISFHVSAALALTIASFLPSAAFAEGAVAPFLPEERVTWDDNLNFELSRNPRGSIAVDGNGIVHLVFWSGGLAVSPETPSSVWYCKRSTLGFWSDPVVVSDSYTFDGKYLGGRHPSLVLRPNGSVFVFWHDYRHCTAAQKWIDNIELYMDTIPSTGSFSPCNIRLTNTSATHSGDNGYVPQAALAPNGEIFLTWYDYHFNPYISDIFLMKSSPLGVFDLGAPIASHRLTDWSKRSDNISYTLPDVAVDSYETAHLVWTRGEGKKRGVLYCRISDGCSPTTPILLASDGGDFFDPPRIVASQKGDVLVLYTKFGAPSKKLILRRLRNGASQFDPPVAVNTSQSNQSQGNLAVGNDGLVHIVWSDDRTGSREIFYGIFDPDAGSLLFEKKVSNSNTIARMPAIALDSYDHAYIVWTDYRNDQGQIFFRTNAPLARAFNYWSRYR